MSIFVTSLGATDNEICAPISQSILNLMNKKGYKFRGIPAIESNIVIEKNEVEYTLNSCHHKTSPMIFSFNEVSKFVDGYKLADSISEPLLNMVYEKLIELEKLTSQHCTHNRSCADCSLISREEIS